MFQAVVRLAAEGAPVIALIGLIVAIATFVKAVIEYVRQTTIKKFEKFQEMSRRFDDNADIQRIVLLLRSGSEELREMEVSRKEVFICFFEEISYMVNSKIMRPSVAFYSFGFYAYLCVDNERFWSNISCDEPFYRVFVDFCRESDAFRSGALRAPRFRPRL
jgi:hypothetical protein